MQKGTNSNNEKVKAFGTESTTAPLKSMNILRREILAQDVEIDILFCGVCHSDLHTARNDWKGTVYPAVPGHEIVGIVTRIGNAVTNFNPGDHVAVGCLIDSCRNCKNCDHDLEQYCLNGFTGTYNGQDKHLGTQTFGGYSEKVIVDQHTGVVLIFETFRDQIIFPQLTRVIAQCEGIMVCDKSI